MVRAFPLRLTIAVFVALLAFGCSCDDGTPIGKADPRPKLSTSSVIFDGAVCAESSHSQTITVTNEGRAQLHGSFRIEGRDAEAFRVSDEEVSVASLGSIEVEVFFEPQTPGAGRDQRLEAELLFESNSTERPLLDVTLDGTVSQLPVTPSFAAEWEVCEGGQRTCEGGETIRSPCCWFPPLQVELGRVSVGRSSTTSLQIRNDSCGELRVEKAEVELIDDDCGEGVLLLPDFEEQPTVVPGSATAEIELVFEPSGKCDLRREITLHSNDSEQPTHTLMVMGQGVEGALAFSPPSLLFSDVAQGASKELVTTGRKPTTADTLRIVEIGIAGEDAEHYSITQVMQCANPLDLGNDPRHLDLAADPLELDEGCTTELDIRVEYEPQGPGLHNDARLYVTYLDVMDEEWESQVNLNGRSAPRLVHYPEVIAFDKPGQTGCGGEDDFICAPGCVNETTTHCTGDTECPGESVCLDGICSRIAEAVCASSCGEASRSFRICNEGVNDLELTKLEIVGDDGTPGGPVDTDNRSDTFREPIFSVDAGTCKAGTLAPNECCEGTVHLLDNRTSGRSSAVLKVHSNDPSWEGKGTPIELDKSTVTVTAPSARFELETSRPTIQEWFTLDARASNAEMGTIEKYEWSLTDVVATSNLPTGPIDPSDVNAGCTRPDGECFELLNADMLPCKADGSDCVILKAKPDLPVTYTFELVASGSVCGPRLEGRWTADVTVRAPEIER